MANTKPDTVTVPTEEWEEMKAKLDRLQAAQLASVGVDPKIAVRATLPRILVQFTAHYTRAAVPSAVQKDVNVIEAYSVSAGDIVRLREDELQRLKAERPALVVDDPKAWKPKEAERSRRAIRDGVMGYEVGKVKIPVEQLVRLAPDVG